jgi:hypothetical protein
MFRSVAFAVTAWVLVACNSVTPDAMGLANSQPSPARLKPAFNLTYRFAINNDLGEPLSIDLTKNSVQCMTHVPSHIELQAHTDWVGHVTTDTIDNFCFLFPWSESRFAFDFRAKRHALQLTFIKNTFEAWHVDKERVFGSLHFEFHGRRYPSEENVLSILN